MKTVVRNPLFIMFCTVFAMTWPVYGQEQISSSDDWEIRLMPYFWAPSLDADATVNGLSGGVELSFDDIIDYLDFTAMGRAEAWKGKWGLTFDGLYMNLGADGSFQGRRGVTSFAIDADVRLGMADFGLAYRIFEQQFGDNSEQRLTVEPYGGLRYAYLRQKINLNVTIAGIGSIGTTLGGSEDWVEPFVGGRILWDLNDKMTINVRGDFGGFGIGSASKLTWNLVTGIDYKLSENTSLQAGYRILDIDYSRGSGSNKFGLDAQTKGPILGLTILF
ncbi:MAG: autotransporter outer membrane beta-barrel domain-containing protein [Planctomycetes bacterium]|nr:autotransporter outer membrane beta-barrel domain-containing protein [Planctomycetota bacterium]